MSDAMAQTILSEASIRARMPGPRSMGLDIGGTKNNITINGTMTPTSTPYAGYLLKSLTLPNLDRLIFPRIRKPANTKCQVDILGASVRANTATGGGADYVTLDAGASAVDDFYNGKTIILKTGTGAGQARVITDYIGSSKRAYVTGVSWTTQPISGTTFEIFDTILTNSPPGFDLQTIDYTVYPTINILCSMERLSGAAASPIMGIPVVESVKKDWASQAPVKNSTTSTTYATLLSTTGECRLDGISYTAESANFVIIKITVDGVVFITDMEMGLSGNTAGTGVFLPFNLVANSSLLVEFKSNNGLTTGARVSWSK